MPLPAKELGNRILVGVILHRWREDIDDDATTGCQMASHHAEAFVLSGVVKQPE